MLKHTVFLVKLIPSLLKLVAKKDSKLGCTKDGFCYNRKRVLAKSVIDNLLNTPFYCDIEIIEED